MRLLILLFSLVFAPVACQAEFDFGPFVFPLVEGRISSGFGRRLHPIRLVEKKHFGIDIAAESGAVVRSVQKGMVIFAGEFRGYGKLVTVLHRNKITTLYAHLKEVSVSLGQWIMAGDKIGLVGSTGQATGRHLHFEIKLGGVATDPANFLVYHWR